jgi:voltage-gated potassium channel
LNPIYRRLLTLAIRLALTLAAGTTGFVVIAGYPLFDAFYMTVITMTTVGYFEVRTLDTAGRMFNAVLILFGVSTMFYAVGVITQTTLEASFSELFQKRRARKMIDSLKDHFILCGYGRVGRGAAAELQRTGVEFVVMDRSEERVQRAIKAGMLAMHGDSTRDETLVEAGVKRARGLVAALSSDADNLFLILSAKSLNPSLTVAARVGEEASEAKMRRAGADAVFMPYAITGYRLAQSILRPHVFEFLDITSSTSNLGLEIGIEQVLVPEGSRLASRSLREMQLRRDLGIIVLAIRRSGGEMEFNPEAEAVIGQGDHLIVMGKNEHVRKLEEWIRG